MLYGHGDDVYKFGENIKINFSSNISGKTGLPGLYRHLAQKIACVAAYPEPAPATLEALLAASCGLQSDEVCVTNGATEAIYLIAQAFHGMKSYVLQPTFSEYADACRLHRHTVKSVYTVDAIDAAADIVWLCNPNNPTGTALPEKTLTGLIASHPSACFVIDRSYEDFTAKKLFSAAEAVKMPHVILLHSATKRYAIPGIRLGYITAPAALLQRIRMQRMPWSVNAPAIEAGYYFLANNPPLQPSLDELLAETGRLQTAISRLKIAEVWPTDTHFFLARLRTGKAGTLKNYLACEHGILIRDASNFEGLDDTFIRIATQSPEENNHLINALEEWKHSFIS
ncbi:MAG: pyridoxal phosphate-dependent class II aminotransferase [Tannerella sp.]|jgi:threonine-phosphate decarboxylase|nr:pyridoxal phosphate-dependent class II aminotransferase [Tannerella sp.]